MNPNYQNKSSTDTSNQDEIIPLKGILNLNSLFEALLKKPRELSSRFFKEEKTLNINIKLSIIATLSLLIFGLTVGSFSMHEQLITAPLKITIGTFISAFICFPSLYIFICLTGTRASLRHILTSFLAMLALMGIILIGVAPIIWVFSQSSNSIGFIGFLSYTAWFSALLFGSKILHNLLREVQSKNRFPIRIWTLIFILVNLQMSTTLRPIIGRSSDLLASEKKSFLIHWLMPSTYKNEAIPNGDHSYENTAPSQSRENEFQR